MERAEILIGMGIRIDAVIETDRAYRQLVAQTRADGIAHIVETDVLRCRQKIPGINEDGTLQFPQNRKRRILRRRDGHDCRAGLVRVRQSSAQYPRHR